MSEPVAICVFVRWRGPNSDGLYVVIEPVCCIRGSSVGRAVKSRNAQARLRRECHAFHRLQLQNLYLLPSSLGRRGTSRSRRICIKVCQGLPILPAIKARPRPRIVVPLGRCGCLARSTTLSPTQRHPLPLHRQTPNLLSSTSRR